MSKEQIESQTFKDCFMNVSALYSVLKGAPQQGIRRAELKQGEVKPEAIDFLSDVELKAKRTLSPAFYKAYLSLLMTDEYELLPIDLQCALGQTYWKNDLNFDGDYRVLYYQAKNARLQDRDEPVQFPEETINPEDVLNES